jgi:hypothetical protein
MWTGVYKPDPILCVAARQKQLAKFKTPKIFLRLELPRSRQRFAQSRGSNLARGCEVAIAEGMNHQVTKNTKVGEAECHCWLVQQCEYRWRACHYSTTPRLPSEGGAGREGSSPIQGFAQVAAYRLLPTCAEEVQNL